MKKRTERRVLVGLELLASACNLTAAILRWKARKRQC